MAKRKHIFAAHCYFRKRINTFNQTQKTEDQNNIMGKQMPTIQVRKPSWIFLYIQHLKQEIVTW